MRLECLPLWFHLLLLAVVGIAYYPALHAGFVWDDRAMLYENPWIEARDGLYWIWFSTKICDYFPLTYTSLWCEWRLWGGAHPLGYHAVNILLHGVNACLLWHVLARLKIPGARLAALIFALHPVNVASVAWITERKNTLSMVFYCAAALWYFRYEASGKAREYVLAIFLFCLALLSKTSVVMLPVALLLCAWWQRGKITFGDLRRTAPFFLLSLVMGLVTIWYQTHNAINGAHFEYGGFFWRLACAGAAVWFYLFNILFPFRLSMLYPRWHVDAASFVWYLPGLALLGGALAAYRFRHSWGRPLLFGLGFFLITLFPVLGFLKMFYFSLSLVADQWLYLPIIGVIALFSAGAVTLARHFKRERLAKVAAVLLLSGLGWLTWNRAALFKDPETFWNDVLKKDPGSWSACINLGVAAAQNGRSDQANDHFQQALRRKPDSVEARFSLAATLLQQGRYEEAITHFREGMKVASGDPRSHYLLGCALQGVERYDEAIAEFIRAANLKPDYLEVFNNLGYCLKRLGRYSEAIAAYQKAIQLQPGYAEAYNNLGIACFVAGQFSVAGWSKCTT